MRLLNEEERAQVVRVEHRALLDAPPRVAQGVTALELLRARHRLRIEIKRMDGRAEMARRETHQPGATTDIQKPKPLESVQLQHFPQRCLRREDTGLVQGT